MVRRYRRGHRMRNNAPRKTTKRLRNRPMRHAIIMIAFALLVAGPAAASEYGSPDEAKAMLEQAVAALEADQDAALAAFNAGEAPFKEKDLYVFCGGPDGNFTAHGANASLIGKSLRGLHDKAGTALGENLYAAATPGEYNVVEYMWPRPGETDPSQKASYVTKVGDQVCAVGYYQ